MVFSQDRDDLRLDKARLPHEASFLPFNVKRVKIMVYAFSGMLASLAGLLYASREQSAPPTAAGGYELDAITAVVVGGALPTGGVGTVRGTVTGLSIVRILANIFNLLALGPLAATSHAAAC